MERYCGFLKAGLRSRRFPWANLNKRVLNYAYLEQIGNRYDLADELEIFGRRSSGPSKAEKVYANCESIRARLTITYLFKDPNTVLRTPYRKAYTPDTTLRKKVAGYFSSALSKPSNTFLNRLPQIMPSWGKVRIVDGDSIRSGSASGKGTGPERDASYVRVSIIHSRIYCALLNEFSTRYKLKILGGLDARTRHDGSHRFVTEG